MNTISYYNMKTISFKTKFAGLSVGICCPSPGLRDFCNNYIDEAPGECDISITVTEQDVANEAARINNGDFTPLLHEISAVQRKIAEEMPFFDRFVMHGATITYNGGAYMFCAPSGTGKSTHISLWRRYLGSSVGIINGDKPFLSLDATNGVIYAHGSPWAGKERWHNNRCAPLRALCFISRAEENSISRLTPEKCLPLLMRQIYMPSSADAALKTLGFIDSLVSLVPIYLLRCNISEDAVKCSFEALTGEKFSGNVTQQT